VTEEQFNAATERLAKMQEQWIEGMRLNIAATKALTERLRSFQDWLDAQQAVIASDENYARAVQKSLQAVLTAPQKVFKVGRPWSDRLWA